LQKNGEVEMYLKAYLQNPVLVAIVIMLIFGVISVYIGKVRKQPLHAAFVLGFILGPLGCLLVFFQKKPLTEQEESNVTKIFNGENPHQFFDEKRIREIIDEINMHIKVLLFGRYIIPAGVIVWPTIKLLGINNLKLSEVMIALVLMLLATINCIFSGYAINFIARLIKEERPFGFFVGSWLDLYGMFYSLAPGRFIKTGKELISKLQVK